jgi:hypothetical protein
MHDWNTSAGGPDSSRRRSQRVMISIAITVTGKSGPSKAEFSETTQTLVVNAHGALVALAAKVDKGQTVLVRNHATREERICKVMFLGPVTERKVQVGLEFMEPAPEFWHIAFPPETWGAPVQPRPTRPTRK